MSLGTYPDNVLRLVARQCDHVARTKVTGLSARCYPGETCAAQDGSLKLEALFSRSVVGEVIGRGHRVAPIPAFSPLAGQAGIISIEADGRLTARTIGEARHEGGASPLEAPADSRPSVSANHRTARVLRAGLQASRPPCLI